MTLGPARSGHSAFGLMLAELFPGSPPQNKTEPCGPAPHVRKKWLPCMDGARRCSGNLGHFSERRWVQPCNPAFD